MKKITTPAWWGLCLLLAGLFCYLPSCYKHDTVQQRTTPTEEFFKVPLSTSGTIKRIAAFIQEQHKQYGFVDQLIREDGYILWDKGDVHIGRMPNRSSIDTIVVLPLVRDHERQVNSLLACRVSGNQIEIIMHRGRLYNRYSFSGARGELTATTLTLELMYLQQKVFGDTDFRVNDPRLFGGPQQADGSKIVKIRSQEAMTGLHSWVTFPIERCYWLGHDGNQGQVVGVPPGGSVDYPYGEWICYTGVVHVLIADYQGGGGSSDPTVNPDPGGGGGGGTGQPGTYGWWRYEPCETPDPNGPGSPQEPGGDGPTEPCINGVRQIWHPLYSLFELDDITDEFTNPCILIARQKLPNNLLKTFAKELLVQSEPGEAWSFVFRENRSMLKPDGNPQMARSYPHSNPANKVWYIELNPIFWEQGTNPTATQALAGASIVHEFVHGFINIYKEKYNITALGDWSEHTAMLYNFIEAMANILANAYDIPTIEAKALALSGLDDVLQRHYFTGAPSGPILTDWNQFYDDFCINQYGISILAADNIMTEYITGQKGTRCF